VPLDEVDLANPDVFLAGIPRETFARLRRESPVHWHERKGGRGFWALTKYEDVVVASRDSRTFSSASGVVLLDDPARDTLTSMDPPRHTRYRNLVNRGFTPRMVARLEAAIRARAVAIIDRIGGAGEVDFVAEVAAELPLQVIAELIGIPMEDRRRVFEWSNAIGSIGVVDPEYAPAPDAAMRAGAEMFAYANELANERRNDPRDDIVTTLINAEVDGERLTEMELDQFFLVLAVAGNETTRHTLSHGMIALGENPEQKAELVKDPSLIPAAVEEMLRWATPVMYFRRTATRDAEIRGQKIRQGDWVVLYYISANYDEDVFADPYRFDIRRDPNPHLSFGGGGPHFCLGAELARLEVRILFEELLRRLPDIEVGGSAVRLRSNFFNGVKHLPVRFTPAR